MLEILQKEIHEAGKKEKSKNLARFFKTGKGQYGEGDIFLGVTVPQLRVIAKRHACLSFTDTKKLLNSPFHEERMVALLILVDQYKKGAPTIREKVFRLYLKNLPRVNNWDLVDLSAPRIMGAHLFNTNQKVSSFLSKLALSKNIWERRVAIISTLYFIVEGDFVPTLNIAKRLQGDKHDLIHKATGWMLREVGKRDVATLEHFLQEENHYRMMPRTMLRYAIERFPETKRKKYLSGIL